MTSPAEHASDAWQIFGAHRGEPFPFFLDRGTSGRASFAGSRPSSQLVVDRSGIVRLFRNGRASIVHGSPVDEISAFVAESAAIARELPEWLTGACLPRTVGFLAYELGETIETPKRTPRQRETVGTPLAVLSTYDAIDAWHPEGGRPVHIAFSAPEAGTCPPSLAPPDSRTWRSTSRDSYRSAFTVIREAIAAGDIYQANLSRRRVFDVAAAPAEVHARLRALQPVPWGAFLDFGGFALVSNSPECFLERSGDLVVTRPIKGTRARGREAVRDSAARSALASDPKELAEHLMIVDLERNDLGRVARTGSVEVSRFTEVESFSTLHHLVSEVRATLREDSDLADLLRATFPGGSITGAPKIRAMEILAEVEEAERGPYTGAIGCFNGAENLELSIAIRTAVTTGTKLLYSAGGGIVADSDVDREWEETELKMTALRRALDAETPRALEATG